MQAFSQGQWDPIQLISSVTSLNYYQDICCTYVKIEFSQYLSNPWLFCRTNSKVKEKNSKLSSKDVSVRLFFSLLFEKRLTSFYKRKSVVCWNVVKEYEKLRSSLEEVTILVTYNKITGVYRHVTLILQYMCVYRTWGALHKPGIASSGKF